LSEEVTPLQPDNLPAKSYIGIFGCMDAMGELGLEMIEKHPFLEASLKQASKFFFPGAKLLVGPNF